MPPTRDWGSYTLTKFPAGTTHTLNDSREGDDDGVDRIIRAFMLERGRVNVANGTVPDHNAVINQIFRDEGRTVSDDPTNDPPSDIGRQLAEIALSLDNDYYSDETFRHMHVLERTPNNPVDYLNHIIRGVFQHGITASHVMLVLIFGYWYIHDLDNLGIENLEVIGRQILNSIISYIKQYVMNWISTIGGWNGFLDEVKEDVKKMSGQGSVTNQWVIGLIVALTAVNIGAIVYQMYK